MSSVRTAIVGCGKVAQLHAQALQQVPESNFVAVCDAQLERAEKFASQYRVQPFQDLQAMLSSAGVEAVMICTPHPLHAEPTVLAANAGVHVLVEKPLASNLSDCDAMIGAAEKSGVFLSVVSQRRYFPPIQRIKQAIDAGKIGKPVLGTVHMLSWRDEAYYRSDPWRGKWETEGGGVLVNQSPHHLDLLQWLMGPVEEVSAYWANLNHPYIEVEDTALAMLRFRNGGLGNIVVSLSQKPGLYTKLHIHGSNGSSLGAQTDSGATFVAGVSEAQEPPFTDLWNLPGEEDQLATIQQEDRQAFQSVDANVYYHALQIQDFLQAILEGRPPAVTAEDGRKVVEIFTAIYRSQQLHQPVGFPLAADSVEERKPH